MAFDYEVFGEVPGGALRKNALKLDTALSSGLRPPPRMSVSEWAAKYRRFPDDAPIPGRWRHENAPYLVEIMDALSPHDPCEEVIIPKCAQSGGTAAIENWIGYISDLAPGPMLFAQSTLAAALEWAVEKLWPMIESTPRLNPDRDGTIKAQGAADGKGSTKKKVKFARSNGFIALAGMNSAATLRSRTMRYAVEDDLDQAPDDLDGQGSPEVMVDQRLKVYRRLGLSKRAKISTPTIKGASKIDAAASTADQRRYHLKCPHCASRFAPIWDAQPDGERDIQWPDGRPEEAYLVPRCCGVQIDHWQKMSMELADGWLSAEIDGEKTPLVMDEETFQALRARQPKSLRRSFEITGLITAFQTWGDMAVEFVGCRGDQNKLKGFVMLTLGKAFELRGSTPDYERLKALKEQHWGRGQMPVGPVVVTQGVDVQGDGVYVERVGHGPNGETWSLDQRFIIGKTDVKGEGAWVDLHAYSKTPVVYPGGRSFPIDQECVDGGYQTQEAEAYCRMSPNRLLVFGRAGWRLPVLGRGQNLKYERQGSRTGFASKKAEDKAYLVGVDGVKLSWYGFLRLTLKAAAEEAADAGSVKPRGLCHFSRDTPDEWFEMVTAETIVTEVKNGWPSKVWRPMPSRQNHYLDYRVYNYAAAEKLMLDTLTEADWAALRTDRYAPADVAQGDLLSMMTGVPAASPTSPSPPQAPAASSFVDVEEGYL